MTMFQNLDRMMGSGATLKIQCEACGHQAAWTKAEAVRLLGADAAPMTVRRRLWCGSCGDADRVRVWI